jgi:WD40 repeat protein
MKRWITRTWGHKSAPRGRARRCTGTPWSYYRSAFFAGWMLFILTQASAQWVFYSQRDPAWSGDQLGTCQHTIASAGAAITVTAMALRRSGTAVDPRQLNNWLRANGGYAQGCLIVWAVAANYPGSNLAWVGTGTLSSIAGLRSNIDGGKIVIVVSNRSDKHWGVIRGYTGAGTAWSDFLYWDPWDLSAQDRRVGDGWVVAGNATRIYQITCAPPGVPNLEGGSGSYPLGATVTVRAHNTGGTEPQQTCFRLSNGWSRDCGDSNAWDIGSLPSGGYTWWAKKRNSCGESGEASRGFHINFPPNIPSDLQPRDGRWLNNRAFTLSWNDPGDPDNLPNNFRDYRVEIRKSDNSWSSGIGWGHRPTTWQVTVPSDGEYRWKVAAGDGWNDRGFSPEAVFGVDATPPVPSPPTFSIPSPCNAVSVLVNASGSDATSGMQNLTVLVGGQPIGTINGASGSLNWNLLNHIEGSHPVQVRARDNAGNEATSAAVNYMIDRTPPITAITTDPPAPNGLDGWFVSPVMVSLNASDPSGIRQVRYSLNAGGEQTYAGPITLPGDGERTVRFYAFDNTNPGPGNREAANTVSFLIDASPPPTPGIPIPESEFIEDPTSVAFRFCAATDPHSGLRQWRYAITDRPHDGDNRMNWTTLHWDPQRDCIGYRAYGLNLRTGRTYYVRVGVQNGAGTWSQSNQSAGFLVGPGDCRVRFYVWGSAVTEYMAADCGVPYSLQGTLGEPIVATILANHDDRPGDFVGDPGDFLNDHYAGFWQTGVPFRYETFIQLQDFTGNFTRFPNRIRLWNVCGELADEIVVHTDSNRFATFFSWANPAYIESVSAKAPHWLTQRVALELPARPCDEAPFAEFILINGDANGDNQVDDADMLSVLFGFGQQTRQWQLAAGTQDARANLWRVPAGLFERGFVGHTQPIWSVHFSPNGRFLLTAGRDLTARMWDVATGAELLRLPAHTGEAWQALFSPNGELIATCGADGLIKLWRAADGVLVRVLTGHTRDVRRIAFSPNGQLLASASYDTTVKIWSIPSGVLLYTLTGHSGNVRAVAFSSDGQYLVSVGAGAEAKLWRVSNGTFIQNLAGHSGNVHAVAFSPDGQWLAIADNNANLLVRRTSDWAIVRSLSGHTASIRSLAFSPDSQMLASAGYDQTIRLWQTINGALVSVINTAALPDSVAFGPNLLSPLGDLNGDGRVDDNDLLIVLFNFGAVGDE